MKTALDFYDRGKQKESSADDYNVNSYSINIKGRFICPECGEPVYLRPSKYSNFFVHYKRTDEMDKCDRRVDDAPTESVYERIGLPIYMRFSGKSKFSLYLGFKALPNELLSWAEKNELSVSIDKKKSFKVNRERFSSEQSVMIPIDYIPLSGQKYRITIQPDNYSYKIKKYWPYYADGFSLEGALFTVTAQGGRKIRHGDNISTETEYYWVRRQAQIPSCYNGINMSLVGKLSLQDTIWNVFKGSFSSSICDQDFQLLADYLRENLMLHLLEKTPEYVPVWPPLTKQEDGYIYRKECRKIFGNVVSGNETPRIYLYRDVSPNPENVYVKNGVAEISPDGANIIINIDRKYVSGGAVFNAGKRKIENANYLYEVITHEKNIEIRNLDSKDVIWIRRNGEVVHTKNKTNAIFKGITSGDVFLIIGYRSVCKKIIIEILEDDIEYVLDEKMILYSINKYKKSYKVYLPYKTRKILESIELNDERLRMEVEEIMGSNKIPYPLISWLKEYFDGKC